MRPSGPVTGAPTVSREPVSRPHCTGQITRRNGIIRIPGRFALPAARSAVACPPHPGHFSAPSEQVPIRQEHTIAHSGRDNDLSADGESKRKNAGCDASLAYRLFRNEKGPAQGRARVLLHRVRPSDRHTRCPSRPTGPSTLRRTVSGPDRGWPVPAVSQVTWRPCPERIRTACTRHGRRRRTFRRVSSFGRPCLRRRCARSRSALP